MLRINQTLMMAFVCLSVAACSKEYQPDTAQDLPATLSAAPTARLHNLASRIWADVLQNSADKRLREGLPIHKFDDYTLKEYRAKLEKNARWHDELLHIDIRSLHGDDRILYGILDFDLDNAGANDDDYWLQFDITAYHVPRRVLFAQTVLSLQDIGGQASADNYLTLVNEYADIFDQMAIKVSGQMERNIYLPKPALPSTRAAWEAIRNTSVEKLTVPPTRLQELTAEERAIFEAELRELITHRVLPGIDVLLELLNEDYEAKAPESVGIGQYPGGLKVYQRLILRETTLNIPYEEIHQIGLQGVEQTAAKLEEIRRSLGFEGAAREFHGQLRKDDRFIAENTEEIERRFLYFMEKLEPKLKDYFWSLPAAPYSVRQLAPALEPGMTFGYYNLPSSADPVGYYNYNGSDLENRSMLIVGHLIYHELAPGHHFHLAAQYENESLPDYRRRMGYSAPGFSEGWAEYCASLGLELGMYDNPYDLYGHYAMEMFFSVRLVVDTGMNRLGWSLQEARDYMSRYLFLSDVEIASETIRYSTNMPAQALAYRIGFEKIWELRHRAENRLGDSFDVRDFHAVVLADGTKPLSVLEEKVKQYIDSALAKTSH